MVKLEDLSEKDQALVKAFELGLKNVEESDKLYMKSLELQEKRIRDMLYSKYEDEPLKLFKKSHKKWEDEIADLEKQLHDVYLKVEDFFKEQQDFYKKLKEA